MSEPPEPTEAAVLALADQIVTSITARSDSSLSDEHRAFIAAFAYALLKVNVPTSMLQEFSRNGLPWYGLSPGRITHNMFAIGLVAIAGEGQRLCVRGRVLFGTRRGLWIFNSRGHLVTVWHGRDEDTYRLESGFVRTLLVAVLRPVMNILDYRT